MFLAETTEAARRAEAEAIFRKFEGNHLPVIVERGDGGRDLPLLDKTKFMVPRQLTWGQLIYLIRRRLAVSADTGLYIFVNNTVPPASATVQEIHEAHCAVDGFLYATYSGEATFG